MILKIGSRGEDVKKIQEYLDLTPDGVFGPVTEQAVKNLQKDLGLPQTGVINRELFEIIKGVGVTTDLSETKNEKFTYSKHWLPKDEYCDAKTPKRYLFLHHTAGNNNPYRTIDIWNEDKRGRIATEFVIGGLGLNGDSKYDGEVVQAFPEGYWAYHLGEVNRQMHFTSVGIELCNFGFLIEKKGVFYTEYGQRVDLKYVCDLGYKFRGHRYFHDYTDKQIESCRRLILFLKERDQFMIDKGLKDYLNRMEPKEAFGYFKEAAQGKVQGILSHTNVITERGGKFDVYPHPKLIEMIKSL
jgi:hypothetical protein